MIDIYLEAALLIAFVGISAFFAAGEVAFLSISSVKLNSLLEKKVRGAESLARLRANKRKVVISLLIGGNVANVAASALATSISIAFFGEAGLGVAIGITSFLLLTFGDIAPKSAATTQGEKMALSFAPVIEVFYYFSYPAVVLFETINHAIPGVYSKATGIEQFTEEDVRSAVKLGTMHKGISEKERELIENVLEFNDRPVSKAMTPKSSVVSLSGNMLVSEAHRKAALSDYSRLPVIDALGKILGVVSIRTLAHEIYEHPTWTVEQICAKPVILQTNDILHDAFAKLQYLGRNIAIVVDEHGNFAGVVTLEDLLEELVGELD